MTRPIRHVLKFDQVDGKQVLLAWCGRKLAVWDWAFNDANHVLVALEESTSIPPCRKCLRAMKRILDEELDG